ncbi:cyclic peptide export ABC transporter [candidate division KSB3 bacterium]|uniref:Cyclic peptide export ABC transporter n=1 Tax=candidate division KSB3 bacterium TaxID=2044937 RepID=A0A9D5JT12_9BACT|nr:cyclic peptide export ABC transporter [candidate division KSB3 bacterium]MBD3323702.1 cyclic peptide export ABC transporter [candidate division KSB3 bacterium]
MNTGPTTQLPIITTLQQWQTLWEDSKAILLKPTMSMAILAALFETALIATLYTVANLDQPPTDRHVVLFLLALSLYILTARIFKRSLHRRFEQRIATIRLNVMDRVRKTDLQTFETIGAEKIYTALTLDVKAISEISYTIAVTVYAIFLLLGVSVYLLLLSRHVFFFVVMAFVMVGGIYAYNQFLITRQIEQVRHQEKHLFEALSHLLNGFKELRLNDKKNDDFFYQSFTHHLKQTQSLKRRITKRFIDNYTITYGFWMALMSIPILLVPLGGLVSGDQLMTFVGIILFLPTNYLAEEIPKIVMASISIQRLYELKEVLALLEDTPSEPPSLPESVEFEELAYHDMTFQYLTNGEHPFAVGPINLSIRAGEILFITGGNGSGKTTLLKLLTGLYHPDTGQSFLNRQPIHIAQHRELFAAIFTDYHLFDRCYGRTQLDAQQIQTLLRTMQLEDTVQFSHGQFSTHDVSTGQKKRLALITAIMEDKPIYIFDEWAADQDPYFRQYFYTTLLPSLKNQGKAVIAVTHDDAYFSTADRIVTMDYGQIVEASLLSEATV